VLMAVVYYPGRIGECDVTPDAYWMVGERCISKIDTLYLSTITRAGGLLLGAAFAMVWRPVAIMRGPMRRRGALVDAVAVVGLLVLGAMTWWVHLVTPEGADPFLFRGGFLVTGVASLMVIAAVTHRRALAGPVLGNPVFLWIGTRSYGLYLYHWPIYQIIREVAGNTLTVTEFAGAMAATAVVTELSYRYIETPIRKRQVGRWWRGLRRSRDPLPRQVVLGAGAVAVVLALFGGVSLATAPLKQNEIAESLDAAADATTDLDDLLVTTTVAGGTAAPATVATTTPATAGGTVAPGPSAVPVVTTPPTTTIPPTTTTLPPDPVANLALGDSVMLGAAPALTAGGIVVNADESRQMVDMIPVVQQLRDQGIFGNAVIVHLGTNGPISQQTVDAFMEPLSAVPNVVVLTVRADRGWTAGNNEKLRALDGRPNVILLDWELLSNTCPGNCFYSDGIHLRSDGQSYYANLIFDVLGIS
jgi:hypothetical protein